MRGILIILGILWVHVFLCADKSTVPPECHTLFIASQQGTYIYTIVSNITVTIIVLRVKILLLHSASCSTGKVIEGNSGHTLLVKAT